MLIIRIYISECLKYLKFYKYNNQYNIRLFYDQLFL